MMLPHSDSVLDEYDRPVPGATVYVYNIDGSQASLTVDGTVALSQPIVTDQLGTYSYFADTGYYREDVWYAGKLRHRRSNIAIGNPGADLSLRFDLSSAGDASKGAGLLSYDNVLTYAPGSLGRWIKDIGQRPFSITGSFALNSLGPSVPANGVYQGVGGNSLSFQTLVSSPTGGADTDNQRAMMLLRSATSDDNNSEEQTLCLLTEITTGYYSTWATSTAYALGANVRVNGNIYRAIVAGTSAGSGTGPTGKAASISDGTVTWQWINDGAIAAKAGLYNEVVAKPGGGDAWADATNLQLESGYAGSFSVTKEVDLTNNSGVDSSIGGRNRYAVLALVQGGSRSTAAIEITSPNAGTTAALWGLHLSGTKLASQAVIGIDASAPVGIGFGTAGGGAVNPTFTDASIVDGSTSPKGIRLAGTYSTAAIEVSGPTPSALSITGTKSLASIIEQSTSPIGLHLAGTYASVALKFTNLPTNAANDAAAATAGVPVGGVYRNGSVLMIRTV